MPAASCREVAEGAPTGTYWLTNPAGGAFEGWCDMEPDGGGWTLVATLHNGDEGDTSWTDGRVIGGADNLDNWQNDVVFGSLDARESGDFKGLSYHAVEGRDVLLRDSRGEWVAFRGVLTQDGDDPRSFGGWLASHQQCVTDRDAMSGNDYDVVGTADEESLDFLIFLPYAEVHSDYPCALEDDRRNTAVIGLGLAQSWRREQEFPIGLGQVQLEGGGEEGPGRPMDSGFCVPHGGWHDWSLNLPGTVVHREFQWWRCEWVQVYVR